jgi:hypothetical protein
MVVLARSFAALAAYTYTHSTAVHASTGFRAPTERAELALPSAKQLDFQTNHGKGCFFHVSAF